jgi:phosphate butyryltransferase
MLLLKPIFYFQIFCYTLGLSYNALFKSRITYIELFMEPLKSLHQLIEIAKQKPRKRLVVAVADDEPVLKAVAVARQESLIEPVLIGNRRNIETLAGKLCISLQGIEIEDEAVQEKAAYLAVKQVKEKKADILMKGLLPTAALLRAVLDKDAGIKKSALLSHFALFESPYYHKLFSLADAAMNIAPVLNEKVGIIKNSIDIYHRLGIENPKVAIICPVEVVNDKIGSTVDASLLTSMNHRHQITGCIIDGPLALDNAMSAEAAKHKGIVSEVAGDVDLLIVPNLDCGNSLYKSLMFLGGASCAAIIAGASVPIVLTSRSDSEQSKLLSIALACALG